MDCHSCTFILVRSFKNFIHNGDLAPLPDPGESGYEIAEFLAFTQQIWYHKARGQVYISDYQGSICQPKDSQLACSSKVGYGKNLFSKGNIEIGVKLFEKEHVFNKYCKWLAFHFQQWVE
ncbi:hypothetical protein PAXRUDRAFT_173917 [Paxillus rubicundulus Ve08.2h10]|uniref:Alpha-type protein kinase domain-containing protein n=1 Tax=Paxillus rubicundulus Ve08.2h10 TaxID=930991 RepID=A0A0D0CVD2_9AGAM|nr:hypothetical protein PAXRUDRAFT_173917 [Paxillus rubicundulus Ve08.2h10]